MSAMSVIRASDNTALIPKYWEKKFLKDQHEKDPLKPFYGSDNIVVTDYDLKAAKGDTVVVTIVGLPDGDGVTDDGDYDSDIGSVEVYDFPVTIHEHGRSYGLAGQMTEKSAAFNSRTVTMNALTNWRGLFNARAVIDALSGLSLHSLGGNVLGDSGVTTHSNVNKVAPAYTAGNTALRYYCGGQTTTDTLADRVATINVPTSATDSTYLMGPETIEDLRRLARTSVTSAGVLVSPIQPINVNGKMLFVLLVSFKQGKNIRASTKWKTGHYYADIRGMENSIYSGQIGVWDGVMIIETDLLHQRVGTTIEASHSGPAWMDISNVNCKTGVSVHRALFLGQKAVAWAWGKSPEYQEFYADHAKTKWAVRITSIYGVKKIAKASSTDSTPGAIVSDSEMGCIVADTCVV